MSKFILALLVILSCLGVGCGATVWGELKPLDPPRYTQIPPFDGSPFRVMPIVVDKNFSVDDQKAIDDALSAWNYVLNGYIVIKVESWNFDMDVPTITDIISRQGLVIMKIDHTNNTIPDKKDNKKTLAWADYIGGTKIWVVRDRLDSEDVFPVMLHEIGHILGAKHEDDKPEFRGYLMYPYYYKNAYNCIDIEAMKKVAKFQILSVDKLNYCY